MNKKSLKKRFLSIILTVVIALPYMVFADDDYDNFQLTDLDVPVVESESSRYSEENLLEVTNFGVFDSEGFKINEFEADAPYPTGSSVTELDEEGTPEIPDVEDSLEEYRNSLISTWGGKKSFAEKRLGGIKENLAEQKERFKKLEEEIALAEEKLEPARERITELQGEVDRINDSIRFAKQKMQNAELLIAEKKLEMKDAMLFLQKADVELEIQEEVVLNYVKLLYEEESRFFDLYDDGSSTVKLLLSDGSVGENLLGQEYFAIMEETGRDVFYDLDQSRQEVIQKKESLLREQEDLEFLYGRLSEEKKIQEEARLAKKQLLEETQGEEEKYALLLEESVKQQLESAIAVQNLQDNIEMIESRLGTLEDGIEGVQQAETFQQLEVLEVSDGVEDSIDIIDSISGTELEQEVVTSSKRPFEWPVPANKITAKFHDPTYPWAGGHNAIDIRAKQYTEIRAPANGLVFQTKDNGYGYSYIVLAHKNNFVTVYGHVTEIVAVAGTTVRKGDLIGYSGGAPGTLGAGRQTTGAHLHFEMYLRGEAVDPLRYLPLEELPIEYVPEEYLDELKN